MRSNVHHLIQQRADQHGASAALTYKKERLTYSELWRKVLGVADGLADMGVANGDRIGVFLDKRNETVAAIFGASAAGCAFVPVNPVLKPQQVAYILADCDVRVLITSPERLSLLAEDLKRCPSLEHVVLVESGVTGGSRSAGHEYFVHFWSERFDQPDPRSPATSRIDVDIAAILYTSGSTGKPKGVVLSHRNLIAGAESVSDYLGNAADDVILAALPLSFDAGFSQLTTAFSVGAQVVLMNYLLPADVVRLCAKHQVTGLTCVPPLWMQIAEQKWPSEVADRLRYFANTGGRMPKTTLDRLRQHFPQAKPYLMYGLTEAFRSTYLEPSQVDNRPDSIGKAIPNAEILVVRPDGTLCEPGEEGELVHRGALVALGYWNDPERTAVRFRPLPDQHSSWRTPELAVWSGDAVVADEEGFLYFVGRKDEMIKTSGYRVSPTEIEEVAYDSGMVRDAVALGVEDPKLGQHVLLVVAARDAHSFQSEDLLSTLRRALPLYMVPASVVVLDEIPRSPNGKFDRARLRRELAS